MSDFDESLRTHRFETFKYPFCSSIHLYSRNLNSYVMLRTNAQKHYRFVKYKDTSNTDYTYLKKRNVTLVYTNIA